MQKIFITTNLFILGTVLASFLSALAYRIYNQLPLKKLLTHPSYCENCEHKLKWYELLPIISWIIQKGKCRKCGSGISLWYFIGELILALNFALFYIYQVSPIYYFVASALFLLSIFDLLYMKIPKKVVHFLLFVGAFYFGFQYFIKFQEIEGSTILWLDSRFISIIPLFEAIILSFFLFLSNKIKESFGMGDILVLIYISFFLNYSNFLQIGSLFWIFTLAGASGIFYIILCFLRGCTIKEIRTQKIPFIPLLYFGFCIFLIFQDIFLNLFLNLL